MHFAPIIAVGFYLVPVLTMITLGLIYLFHNRIMPYHQKALAEKWKELPLAHRVLLNTLVRAIGTYSLVSGLALLLLLLFPFRNQEPWAMWAVPILSLLYVVLTILIAKNLRDKTPGGPPVYLLFLLVLFIAGGLACSLIH